MGVEQGGVCTTYSCRENVNLKLSGVKGSRSNLPCELCRLPQTTMCCAQGWHVPGQVELMHFIP